jgi:hypothetical protein
LHLTPTTDVGAAGRRSRVGSSAALISLLLCGAFAIGGCGSLTTVQVVRTPPVSALLSEAPRSIIVERRSGLVRASVAAAGNFIYVGVGTYGVDRFSMFRVSPTTGRVRPLPSVEQVRSGAPSGSMVAWNGNPCVAASDGHRPDVLCFDGSRWISQQLPTGVDGWAIQQLLAINSTLHVLLIDPRAPSHGVIASRNGTTWTPYFSAPSVDPDAILYLGGSAAGRDGQLVIGSVSSRVREVFSRDWPEWTRIAQAPMSGLPNQNSGPVLTPSSVLFSRSSIKSLRWPFYVDAAPPGGQLRPATGIPLSKPKTASQGRLVLARGQPWVTWEEAQVARKHNALRRAFVARLDDRGHVRERHHVATFRSVIASSLDIVAVGDAVYALSSHSAGAPPYRATVELTRIHPR